MKPLVVLLTAFALSCLTTWLTYSHADLQLSARIGMAAMLVLTAMGHFMFTKGMVMMMPDMIPFKKFMVQATGLLELLAAIGLLIPATVTITGILLIIFFVLILPSNIKAAREHINLEKADHSGPGLNYLWFRVPEQVLFVVWVWWIL